MQQLYELNVRTWASLRAAELGRAATFDDLGFETLDKLVEDGFTWLYLIGVWQVGAKARAVSLRDESLRRYIGSVFKQVDESAIIGSPFAHAGYLVCPELGGDDALERLRDRARTAGLSLMLDFVPNHIGLDHPWLAEHPEWLIQGSRQDLEREPHAWVESGGRVFAHGRDPFFAPWRATVQLDYARPELQQAMIRDACSVAARCDGVRCDVAMLLLPDVFASTWGRQIQPFWKECLARVRAEHPGTLFMAEVYWNREYELQQAGFDFTYDKILYDRLLAGDPESIRAHLRAAQDYQRHCVRFIENHEEQRAAARFPHPEHHRGALMLTGMVPGMLLCHHGQEDGRALHSSVHYRRRPDEPGSPAHRDAYRQLMRLLTEPARQEGTWQLVEPRHGHGLIGCLWSLPAHHALLVVVNADGRPCTGALDLGMLADRDWQLTDVFAPGTPRPVNGAQLARHGLEVQLGAWGVAAWRILPSRSGPSQLDA